MDSEDYRYREEDIKRIILEKEHIFGDIGKSALIFEKGIMRDKKKQTSRTIVDCMVFTENKGIIGIEIKTERDSTRRLNKQLRDYSFVCDYVYVMCHDDHLEKVEQIIKRYKHDHVGIVSYVDFQGEPVVGIYKEATLSPNKSIHQAMDMIHKQSIVKMLGTFSDPGRRFREELGVNAYTTKSRGGGVGYYAGSGFSTRQAKALLVGTLINKLGGPEEANRVLCQVFIHNLVNPDSAITLKHFNHKFKEES